MNPCMKISPLDPGQMLLSYIRHRQAIIGPRQAHTTTSGVGLPTILSSNKGFTITGVYHCLVRLQTLVPWLRLHHAHITKPHLSFSHTSKPRQNYHTSSVIHLDSKTVASCRVTTSCRLAELQSEDATH